jgi:hypothetical protein
VVITAAASGQMLRFNGSSWVNEDSPYDVGMFIPGTHGNGALLAQVVLTRAVSFADDFAGARAYAGVSATAETVLDVHRNGSPIGTITFGIGASTGTFATPGGGAETFAAGDRLAIINQDPADATLSDLSNHLSRQEDLTMAWGSDTAATQLSSITTEQFFDQVPTLNPRETAQVQVSVDFPASPTDHAVVAVYTTLDDTSEVWDLIPMMEFLLENTTDPNRISFLVTGVYKFRVGVRRSGSTDTITSADLSLRKDGVNA